MFKSMPSLSFCLLLCALWTTARATTPKKANPRELRDTSESFARRLRWGDYKGMAQFLRPEARLAFVKGVLDRGDDELLKVIDCELEHVQYLEDGAVVLARVVWHRLPSVTAQSEVVSLHFEDAEGQWLIGAVEGGPLPVAKSTATDAAAGREETADKRESLQKL